MPVNESVHVHPDDLFLPDGKHPRESRVVPEDLPVGVYHEKSVVGHRQVSWRPVTA